MKDLLPVLEQVARDGKPLLIVAEEIEGEYEDLVQAGVIDPTKVARTALQNAASVGISDAHHHGDDRGQAEGQGRRRRWRRDGWRGRDGV